MKWYEKIKEYRLDRGWTQDELAEKMANTTLRVALALADALDADPRELMQK